jgi:hypothetical protein
MNNGRYVKSFLSHEQWTLRKIVPI